MAVQQLVRLRLIALMATLALVFVACAPGETPTPPAETPAAETPAVPGETPADTPDATPGEQIGGSVSVIGTWGGDEEESFRAMIAPFEERTGITVEYTGTRDINAILTTGVASGILPDLAGLPGPGQMREFAERGALQPLDDKIDIERYRDETAQAFLDLGSVNDQVYGVFIKSGVKGLVWYNPQQYDGGEPDSMDALYEQAGQAGGQTEAWCIGLESGAASGWPGTDWIENILIRQAGPDVYDQWVDGELAWTSPEVRAAFEEYGRAVQNAHGGPNYVINTNFGSAANPMFQDPPGCLFHHQASFITSFFETEAGATEDQYDFFPMPDINPEYAGALTGVGDLFGMFNDTPQARALIDYLTTAEAQQIWVDRGGALSVNTTVTDYPDEISQRLAEIGAGASVFRFDGSDLMPEAMNNAFWTAMLEYTQNPAQLDSILQNLDSVQQTAYE
jgi:alpha-glucoside transport system substrate-binding protein